MVAGVTRTVFEPSPLGTVLRGVENPFGLGERRHTPVSHMLPQLAQIWRSPCKGIFSSDGVVPIEDTVVVLK